MTDPRPVQHVPLMIWEEFVMYCGHTFDPYGVCVMCSNMKGDVAEPLDRSKK